MILPGGVSGPFGEQVPVTLVPCQVLFVESADAVRVLDLVTLEERITEHGRIPAGTPFTFRWAVDDATQALSDAVSGKWARHNEMVELRFGNEGRRRWVSLRGPAEQLVLEMT
jgi:hypothetical protein